MEVVLDTNILIQDYRLQSRNFTGLFRYLKKTNGHLIILDYVYAELLKNYRSDLVVFKKELDKQGRRLLKKNTEVDVESEIIDYEHYLRTHPLIRILKTEEVGSKTIFDRYITRTAPFKSSGVGVGDFLIWNEIASISNKNQGKFYAFVSSNTSDFGKDTLLPDLRSDLTNPEQLIYHNSLKDFLAAYGKKIDFINQNSIGKLLEVEHDYILKNIETYQIGHIDGRPEDSRIMSIDSYSLSGFLVENYFIYSFKNEVYKVQAEIKVFLDLELTLENYLIDTENQYLGTGHTECIMEIPICAHIEKKEVTINHDDAASTYYRR